MDRDTDLARLLAHVAGPEGPARTLVHRSGLRRLGRTAATSGSVPGACGQ